MRIPKNRAVATVAGLVAAGGITGGAMAVASASTTSGTTTPSASSTSTSGSTSGSTSRSATAPAAPRGPGRGQYDADGTVTSVSAGSLTVRTFFGSSSTYKLSSSTKVHQGPQTTLTRSAIDTGEHVTVHGSKTSSGLAAVDVDVHTAHVDGTVTAISGSSITVKDPDGFTRQISVSSSAKYTVNGSSSSSSALRTGRFVHAEGKVDSNGTSLDASVINIQTKAPTPPAGGPAAPGGAGAGGKAPRPPAGTAPSGSPKSGSSTKSGGTSGGSTSGGSTSGTPSAQPSSGSGSAS